MSVSTSKLPMVGQLLAQGALRVLLLLAMIAAGVVAGMLLGFSVFSIWAISVGTEQSAGADSEVWATFIWVLGALGGFVALVIASLRVGKALSSGTLPRPASIRIQVAKAIVANHTGGTVNKLDVGFSNNGSLTYSRETSLMLGAEKHLTGLLGDVAVLVTGVSQSDFVMSRRRMRPVLASIDERLSEIQVCAALAGSEGELFMNRAELMKTAVRMSTNALEEAPRGLAERLEHEMSRRLYLTGDRFRAIYREFIIAAQREDAKQESDVVLNG